MSLSNTLRTLFFTVLLVTQGIAQENDFLLGGIQINEAKQETWAKQLKKVGMNTVEVTVYARQGAWNSDSLWYDTLNIGITPEVRAAKAENLKVVLILRVLLDHAFEENKFLWHGMIWPETDQALNSWFAKYQAFVLFWARYAKREGIEVLGIGSELNALSACKYTKELPILEEFYLNPEKQEKYISNFLKFQDRIQTRHLWVRGESNYASYEAYLTDRSEVQKQWAQTVAFDGRKYQLDFINQRRKRLKTYWLNMIKHTRQQYDGLLTYASNFDNYHEVAFWYALDYIGINAYFKLRSNPNIESPEKLYSACSKTWKNILTGIQKFQQREHINMPILFTELGYTYRKNCTLEPWAGAGFSILEYRGKKKLFVWEDQEKSQIERSIAVNALHKTAGELDFPLQGILYWKLTTHAYHLPYEPFALVIAHPAQDVLQDALRKFRNLPRS